MAVSPACHATSSAWYLRAFGEHLVTAEGTTLRTEDVLSCGKCEHVIGLYFTQLTRANNNVPPSVSTKFTNKLLQLYEQINCNEPKRLQVIQVFLFPSNVSSQESFHDDFIKQALLNVPWFAMPLHQQIKQIRLKHKYDARDCSLVLLDGSTGKELTRSARERVIEDPTGLAFPWSTHFTVPTKQQISSLLSRIIERGLLCGGSGSKPISSLDHESCKDALQGNVIGVYFSAHWCPPCRAFTPQLIDTYNKLKERGKKFQVLFVSSDRSLDSFESYFSIMPWLALPYDETESRQDLAKLFDIHGIPTLVLLDTDQSLITIEGRGEINDDPQGKRFPWNSPIRLLTERTAARLYNTPAVVLFLESENEDDLRFGESVLTTAAKSVQMEADEFSSSPIIFFVAFDSNTSEWLRDYVGIEDDAPLLTIIDLPLGRISIMEYGVDISEESVNEFVASFSNNTLPFNVIGQL
ncbi:hypothetical protein LSTR_LSTR012033 [Laodelphax striatellus]|uniref:Nucleoredoxin n=1 Tax=Laodelphax striatellus TaxID=195883 RepID=A0A482XMS7_LAOST|nr:hypothetical protein LSTR_LSTR012033 [Laodelphax striatellus]